jgi:hypothetical protein
MRGLLALLFPGKRRRGLPTHLVTPFDMRDVSDDELIIFRSGRARDRAYVERLMRRYHTTNAVELLKRMPGARQRSLADRILVIFQRGLGALPYDPTRRIYRQIRQGTPQPFDGFHVNELSKRRRY